mgnify:CR=1 FL=1
MRDENLNLLFERYPKMFAKKDHPGSWGGIYCGDGWFTLIDTLCSSIQRRIDNNKNVEQVVVEQIKEKFGESIFENLFNGNAKLRICFDLDNTLVTYPSIPNDYSTVKPIQKNINLLKNYNWLKYKIKNLSLNKFLMECHKEVYWDLYYFIYTLMIYLVYPLNLLRKLPMMNKLHLLVFCKLLKIVL